MMLILLSAALFGFGLLLFGLGVAVWLVGLALRIIIRLFRLTLLIIWAGLAFANWLQQRRKVIVLEGEILPPEQRALPRLTKLLLFAGVTTHDGRLHVHIPVCFYANGDVYMESQDGYLTFNNRKAGALHPAVKCTGVVESAERVDPTTFLVRVYCKGATPEREAVSVQLIDDTIHIRNTEAY
jgi:hypothetical protein